MIATVSVMGILDNTGNGLKGLRLLVLTKEVDLTRRIQIASNLTYTLNDFDISTAICNYNELRFYDYFSKDINLLINKWNLAGIGVVKEDFCSNIKRVRFDNKKLGVFLDYLKVYNPNICLAPLQLKNCQGAIVHVDTAPQSMNYIHVNGVAVCHYRPKAITLRDFNELNFNYMDGILVFSKYEDIFILSNVSVRHIPVSLGEELTINLGNGYCMKTMSYIENNIYYRKTFCFDSLQRQWKVVSSDTPIEVLGRKKR